jgi:hypothetical protein
LRYACGVVEPGAPQSRQVAFEIGAQLRVGNRLLQPAFTPPVRPCGQAPLFGRQRVDEFQEFRIDRRHVAMQRRHARVDEQQQRRIRAFGQRRQQQSCGAVRGENRLARVAQLVEQARRPVAP